MLWSATSEPLLSSDVVSGDDRALSLKHRPNFSSPHLCLLRHHPSLTCSVAAVESVQSTGKVCILDIDVQGVQNVKKSSLTPYYIFIAPPSMEILEQRLRGRGTEKEADVKKRLANAKAEMEYGMTKGNVDAVLVNDDLTKSFDKLVIQLQAWYPSLQRPRPVVFAGPSGVGKVRYRLQIERRETRRSFESKECV